MIAAAGIGLRHPHLPLLAAEEPAAAASVPWLEIHSENFLCDGGPRLAMLDVIAARWPVSCHGVGLSLGSADGPDRTHLARLKRLFARVSPILVSEHLAWSVSGGVYLNDLLPLPYTEATLAVVADNVAAAQDAFGCQILIENPSAYVSFKSTTMPETIFLAQLVEKTKCGLLLDVNNIFVSAANNKFSARNYLDELPFDAVREIHLAGHSVVTTNDGSLLIDTHNTRVADDVWDLFAIAVARVGPRPTLIEWDRNIPDLSVLCAEASRAQAILNSAQRRSDVV